MATTAANGTWSARLPAGPSRLVEASYAGAPTLEPTVSAQVHVVVPAKVRLISVSPRRVAWGGTVRIVGQLIGGLPAAGRGARAAADRLPLLVHDLRGAGARDRERQVLDHVHVRARRPERRALVLVPDRLAADGRLSLGAGRFGEAVGARRRPSSMIRCRRPGSSHNRGWTRFCDNGWGPEVGRPVLSFRSTGVFLEA